MSFLFNQWTRRALLILMAKLVFNFSPERVQASGIKSIGLFVLQEITEGGRGGQETHNYLE